MGNKCSNKNPKVQIKSDDHVDSDDPTESADDKLLKELHLLLKPLDRKVDPGTGKSYDDSIAGQYRLEDILIDLHFALKYSPVYKKEFRTCVVKKQGNNSEYWGMAYTTRINMLIEISFDYLNEEIQHHQFAERFEKVIDGLFKDAIENKIIYVGLKPFIVRMMLIHGKYLKYIKYLGRTLRNRTPTSKDEEYMNARGYERLGLGNEEKPFMAYLPRELARANNAALLKEKIAREKDTKARSEEDVEKQSKNESEEGTEEGTEEGMEERNTVEGLYETRKWKK